MQHVFYSIELALLLAAAIALPIATYVSYRRSRGSRGAIVGNCLWAAGSALFLIMPAALTLDNLHWIHPDAGLRDLASSLGGLSLPLGLLLSMIGLVLRPVTAKKETAR